MAGRRRVVDRFGDQGGFTISELVVVLLVFGGLVAITVISVRGIRTDQAATECRTELRKLKAASAQYQAQYHEPAPDMAALEKAGLRDASSVQGWTYHPTSPSGGPAFTAARSACR